MARWEPGTRDRLQRAALELFVERGFDETTVAEIAQAAGLTERTFFRHFADKREVIFDGQEDFSQAFLDGVQAARPDDSPLTVGWPRPSTGRRRSSPSRTARVVAQPPGDHRRAPRLARSASWLKLSGLAIEVAAAPARPRGRRARGHAGRPVVPHGVRRLVRDLDRRRRDPHAARVGDRAARGPDCHDGRPDTMGGGRSDAPAVTGQLASRFMDCRSTLTG